MVGGTSEFMRSKTQTYYVIFAGPPQHGGPGTRYVTADGSVTDLKSKAEKFVTFGDAEDFAKGQGIELTAIRYIGTEEFRTHEV
jgi:hypothetical protein